MRQIKVVTVVFVLASLCLSISGCTTLKESRGYLNEDVGNLIFDIQDLLTNLDEKTSIIRNHP